MTEISIKSQKLFFLKKILISILIIFRSHKNSVKNHAASLLWIFFVKKLFVSHISSTIKLYWKFDFFGFFWQKNAILKNRKIQKFSWNLKLPTSKIFWKQFLLESYPKKILKLTTSFFPKKFNFFSSFWAIPLFFWFFFENFFRKKCSKIFWSYQLQKKIFPKKLQYICSSPVKNLGYISKNKFKI